MRASGTFTVINFAPTSLVPDPAIVTALPVGVSTIEKRYEGAIVGRSAATASGRPRRGRGAGGAHHGPRPTSP